MLKKSCYIFVFVLCFIKIDPVFSGRDSSGIDTEWETEHYKPSSLEDDKEISSTSINSSSSTSSSINSDWEATQCELLSLEDGKELPSTPITFWSLEDDKELPSTPIISAYQAISLTRSCSSYIDEFAKEHEPLNEVRSSTSTNTKTKQTLKRTVSRVFFGKSHKR